MRDVYSFLQSFIFKSWTAQDPQKKKKSPKWNLAQSQIGGAWQGKRSVN